MKKKLNNPEPDMQFYKPETSVSGPAYSRWFKCLATMVTLLLAAYGLRVVTGFPLAQYGFGIKALLAASGVMLLLSYYWFLKSTITIDESGITQTWMYNRHVAWRDVRSAKMIGIPIPCISVIFPPRMVVRTGNAYATFNGGSQAVLVEFARISLAFQMKP